MDKPEDTERVVGRDLVVKISNRAWTQKVHRAGCQYARPSNHEPWAWGNGRCVDEWLESTQFEPCARCRPDLPAAPASPAKDMAVVADRFWAKVDKRGAEDCWLWTGSAKVNGHGQMHFQGMPENVHRVALMLRGVDLKGAIVHHVCEVKLCVNPAHLEVLWSEAEHRARHATGCAKHGEQFMAEKGGRNVGQRFCRKCQNDWAKRKRRIDPEYREQRNAATREWRRNLDAERRRELLEREAARKRAARR